MGHPQKKQLLEMYKYFFGEFWTEKETTSYKVRNPS